MTDRRWPVQTLLERAHLSPKALKNKTGGDAYQFMESGLSDAQADRWALRCGLLPHEVWPEWIDAGLSHLDRQYLAGGWRQAWLWNEAAAETEREAA